MDPPVLQSLWADLSNRVGRNEPAEEALYKLLDALDGAEVRWQETLFLPLGLPDVQHHRVKSFPNLDLRMLQFLGYFLSCTNN